MLTVAFLGCAHIHTPGFVNKIKNRSGITVKSVWDPQPARAQKRAADLNAQVVEDYRKILRDKQIAAVIICSETDRHQELVRAAARAKKPMFVEKPLGMGAKDGWKMADALEKAGVLFQTGYFSRSNPVYRFLRDEVQNGAFGKITRIRGSNCHSGALGGWFDSKPHDPAADWRWMAEPTVAGVGAFGDLGTHLLDIMLWMMGPVTTATASIGNGTARYAGCDETGEGLLNFENGAIGTLAAGWDDVSNPVTLLISGTEAHATVIEGKLYYHRKKVADEFEKNVKELDAAANDPARSETDRAQLQQTLAQKKAELDIQRGRAPWTDLPPALPHAFDLFLDAVAGQPDQPLVTPREAAYRSAVMEAMYEGAKKNKFIAPRRPSTPGSVA